ncbi:MAG: GNAT family N-acetyltransferase [Bacteroidales bacterium]|nr:GNAT family N-acetyltransferase [Bacteroidales bacterium]
MIKLYSIESSKEWDDVVRSFQEWDVYYLSGYVKAFYIIGDGEPFLLYYEEGGLRAIYLYMRRQTSLLGVYDSITPYGYGGVLFEGDTSNNNLRTFWKAYVAKMKEENIVDGFSRYHPVLKNADPMRIISNVTSIGKTIAIDLSSPELIWNNFISKNRNMIRKAEKNGIVIFHGQGMELMDKFIEMYNNTMQRDNAEDYYFFKRPFYESIDCDLKDNYQIFFAVLGEQIIAMSIMLYGNKQMHYHLSGSLKEYRNLAPSNLLLYKAALWGCEQGFKTFHLGGGVGAEEDSLYKFKVAFNKNSNYQFSIGKQIFDQEMYDKLVNARRESDPSFDESSTFFPLYRS